MKNIAIILKDAPKGLKLYSPIMGVCYLDKVDTMTSEIYISFNGENINVFDKYGRYEEMGECLLFPSETNRDWSAYEIKPYCEFKPFEKVLVRNYKNSCWKLDLFSHPIRIDFNGNVKYMCVGNCWVYCIPYNEDTAKLLGTENNYEE